MRSTRQAFIVLSLAGFATLSFTSCNSDQNSGSSPTPPPATTKTADQATEQNCDVHRSEGRKLAIHTFGIDLLQTNSDKILSQLSSDDFKNLETLIPSILDGSATTAVAQDDQKMVGEIIGNATTAAGLSTDPQTLSSIHLILSLGHPDYMDVRGDFAVASTRLTPTDEANAKTGDVDATFLGVGANEKNYSIGMRIITGSNETEVISLSDYIDGQLPS
jgi:hypothetical protein